MAFPSVGLASAAAAPFSPCTEMASAATSPLSTATPASTVEPTTALRVKTGICKLSLMT